jgi:hypothetical protein
MIEINDIRIMLGDAVDNFTDEQILLYYKMSVMDIKIYTNREHLDDDLEMIAKRITVLKLNRINTEGLASVSYSGISNSYIDGYPDDIKSILRMKRKLKVI